MFNLIILEDEAINRNLLRQLIEEYVTDINIVAECATVQDAYFEIQKYNDPLIIALDIELNTDESGFDLIQLIKNRNDSIIVVSAFPEYAIKAFRLDVIDFVPKPIRIKELVGAFERVKIRNNVKHSAIDNLSTQIGIQLFSKTTFIDSKDIIFIQSDLSGTRVHLKSGITINSIERIGQIEARLDKLYFARVDKSNIINFLYVHRYTLNEGQLLLEVQNEKFIVARRKKSNILELLGNK